MTGFRPVATLDSVGRVTCRSSCSSTTHSLEDRYSNREEERFELISPNGDSGSGNLGRINRG